MLLHLCNSPEQLQCISVTERTITVETTGFLSSAVCWWPVIDLLILSRYHDSDLHHPSFVSLIYGISVWTMTFLYGSHSKLGIFSLYIRYVSLLGKCSLEIHSREIQTLIQSQASMYGIPQNSIPGNPDLNSVPGFYVWYSSKFNHRP